MKLAKKEAKPAAAATTKPKAEKKTTEKKAAAPKKATATVCLTFLILPNFLLTPLPEGQGHHHQEGRP